MKEKTYREANQGGCDARVWPDEKTAKKIAIKGRNRKNGERKKKEKKAKENKTKKKEEKENGRRKRKNAEKKEETRKENKNKKKEKKENRRKIGESDFFILGCFFRYFFYLDGRRKHLIF